MMKVAKTSDFGVLFSTIESGRTRGDNIRGRDSLLGVYGWIGRIRPSLYGMTSRIAPSFSGGIDRSATHM